MSEEFLISWHGATNLLQCKCILSIGNYQKVIIHKNTLTIGEFDLLEFANVWVLFFSHDSNHANNQILPIIIQLCLYLFGHFLARNGLESGITQTCFF